MTARPARAAAAALCLVALMAIAAALWATGGPGSARNARLDERRASDIERIAVWIVRPLGRDGNAPERLEGTVPGHLSPTDPVTGEPYRYRTSPDGGFEICTTIAEPELFVRARPRPLVRDSALGLAESWDPVSGRLCVGSARMVDPD